MFNCVSIPCVGQTRLGCCYCQCVTSDQCDHDTSGSDVIETDEVTDDIDDTVIYINCIRLVTRCKETSSELFTSINLMINYPIYLFNKHVMSILLFQAGEYF